MDTLFIVNPTAGGGRARGFWRRWDAVARRTLGADVAFTEAPGHARELARQAVSSGYQRIVAVGGDGTLHEVVNGVVPSRVEVGVVPLGTGNDFARCVGVPRDPARAIFGLVHGYRRTVDLGTLGGQYYLHVAGAGFDAEVAALVHQRPGAAGGAVPYVLTALRVLTRYENGRYDLILDDRHLEQTCVLVAVGNAPAYGGGMRICPRARLDDGLLDVCVIGDLDRVGVLALLPTVFAGAHVFHPRVSYYRARRVRVEGPPATAVHADGEAMGRLPAEFGIAAGALEFWVPGAP